MIKRLVIGFNLAIVAAVCLFIWFINAPRGMVLLAVYNVRVFKSEDEARMPKGQALPTRVIQAGESVPVKYCYNTKDYPIVQVEEGYILDGGYKLLRYAKEVHC